MTAVAAPPVTNRFFHATVSAVTHLTPMLSLANAFSEEEVAEFDERLKRILGLQADLEFVAEPKIVHVRQLTSFSEDLAGLPTDSVVLDLRVEPASPEVAARLGVDAGEPVYRLERVRRAGSEPLAHETAYVPGSLPDLEREFTRRGSLYETLRDAYGQRVVGADDEVETALASPAEAEILGTEVGLPLLVIRRTAWNRDGTVMEWTRSVFRGDRFRFHARIGEVPARV